MAESWKPKDWDALISGESCPVCDLVHTAKQEDEHLLAVADLRFSRLFLAKNQYVPGYCVVICRRHVIEPYELTAANGSGVPCLMRILGAVVPPNLKAMQIQPCIATRQRCRRGVGHTPTSNGSVGAATPCEAML